MKLSCLTYYYPFINLLTLSPFVQLIKSFLYVRVFNLYAPSNQTPQIKASYRKHENEKRRKYEQIVVEIEHSTFIPFVLACTGGVGPAATLTLKRVRNLAEKHNSLYSHVMGFLRTRLSFALLCSTLMCLRGTSLLNHSHLTYTGTQFL